MRGAGKQSIMGLKTVLVESNMASGLVVSAWSCMCIDTLLDAFRSTEVL